MRKGILKICSKFTEEHPCRSVISIKLQSNFTEIAFRYVCYAITLLHIFRIPFYNRTYLNIPIHNNREREKERRQIYSAMIQHVFIGK